MEGHAVVEREGDGLAVFGGLVVGGEVADVLELLVLAQERVEHQLLQARAGGVRAVERVERHHVRVEGGDELRPRAAAASGEQQEQGGDEGERGGRGFSWRHQSLPP